MDAEESGTAVPEISVGYDNKSYEDVTVAGEVTQADSYMVGLTWKDMILPDDRIGLAFTQPLKATEFREGAALMKLSLSLGSILCFQTK